MAGILRITTATPQLPSQKNMKNIVDDIIKKTIDDDIQETITVILPNPQNNSNHEFRPIMLDSDNDNITPDQTSNSYLY